MFYNLAFKNVLRSFKDYSVYFLTLTFGVCIFYVFNSMDSQQVMLDFTAHQSMMVFFTLEMINIVSGIVSLVLAGLILYANNFILRRRKREFGLYMTLGVQRHRIALMLLVETLVIGVLSLGAGLLLGLVFSQTLSVFAAKIYHVDVINYHFVVSRSSLFKTLQYFAIIFLVVGLFNVFSISRARLIGLLQANRRNEGTFITRHLWVSIVFFLAAVALLGGAYAWILKNGLYTLDLSLPIIIAMGCVGTLLFFLSLSGFMLKFTQMCRGLYYKHLNMFVLRQLTSKLGSAFGSMAMVCLMLLLTIGAFGSAFVVNDASQDNLQRSTPFDVTFRSEDDIDKLMECTDLDDELLTNTYSFATYSTGAMFAEYTTPYAKLLPYWKNANYESSEFFAVSARDYNECMRRAGRKPVELSEGQFAVLSTFKPMVNVFCAGQRDGAALTIAGTTLTTGPILDQPPRTQDAEGIEAFLVLPQSVIDRLEPVGYSLVGDYAQGVENGLEAVQKITDAVHKAYRSDASDGESAYEITFYGNTRENIQDTAISSFGALTFIGVYIGLVFLVASAAVLAIQQLSQSTDDQERYRLLRKLGTDERMISSAVIMQIALYFLMPLGLAIIHSCVGLYVVLDMLASFGNFNPLNMVVFIVFFLVTIYGGYFLLTCWGSRRIIRERTQNG